MEDENLVERCRVLGEHMMTRLKAMDLPAMKAVRGVGLLTGIEIDPAYGSARTVCERLVDAGVLSKETHHTVIRLAPPLVIAKEDLDWALDRIAEVIGALSPEEDHPDRQSHREAHFQAA
jgi:ornithine--oxo-acid transaminase